MLGIGSRETLGFRAEGLPVYGGLGERLFGQRYRVGVAGLGIQGTRGLRFREQGVLMD